MTLEIKIAKNGSKRYYVRENSKLVRVSYDKAIQLNQNYLVASIGKHIGEVDDLGTGICLVSVIVKDELNDCELGHALCFDNVENAINAAREIATHDNFIYAYIMGDAKHFKNAQLFTINADKTEEFSEAYVEWKRNNTAEPATVEAENPLAVACAKHDAALDAVEAAEVERIKAYEAWNSLPAGTDVETHITCIEKLSTAEEAVDTARKAAKVAEQKINDMINPDIISPAVDEETDREKFLKAKKVINTRPGRALKNGGFATEWVFYNCVDKWERTNKATAAAVLKEFGLDIFSFLKEKEKWVAEGIARSCAQIAIEEQAYFIADKISRESKPVDGNNDVFSLLPNLEDLNDVGDEFGEDAEYDGQVTHPDGCVWNSVSFKSYVEAYSWIRRVEAKYPEFKSEITKWDAVNYESVIVYKNSSSSAPNTPDSNDDELIDPPEVKAPVEDTPDRAEETMKITTKESADGKITAYYIDGKKVRKAEVEYYACNPAYDGIIEIDYFTAKHNFPNLYNYGLAVVFKNWIDGSDVVTKSAAKRLGLKLGRLISLHPAIYRVEKEVKIEPAPVEVKSAAEPAPPEPPAPAEPAPVNNETVPVEGETPSEPVIGAEITTAFESDYGYRNYQIGDETVKFFYGESLMPTSMLITAPQYGATLYHNNTGEVEFHIRPNRSGNGYIGEEQALNADEFFKVMAERGACTIDAQPPTLAYKPDTGRWEVAIANNLNDVFSKTFHKVAAPFMDVTTQGGAKIVTNFASAYISADWRAMDGYVFGNHYDDVLARYDTPEQIIDVMTALRDAIKAGKTEFTFPAEPARATGA